MEESKKRDFWSDRDIRSMLSIVHEKHILQLIDSKTKRNRTIFEDIASELKKKNICKNHTQVRNKFKSLKSDFFKAKRNNNKSGAKRQTSEHFELLDEIFGTRSAFQPEKFDLIEMDYENSNTEYILQDCEEPQAQLQTAEEESNLENATNENNKQRSCKRTRKQGYHNVVKSFTNDWKECQKELLQSIKEHDQNLMDQQRQNQEELFKKSMETLERILEKDRQETSKMLQDFLNVIQPMQPFVLNQPSFREPSSPNDFCATVPKLSPQDDNERFV